MCETEGHAVVLILPVGEHPGREFVSVGTLARREVDELVVAYEFDLRSNELRTTAAPNANAGREHVFVAYRLSGDPEEAVTLRNRETVLEELRSAEAMPHED
jgi:hypothetical protein